MYFTSEQHCCNPVTFDWFNSTSIEHILQIC